MSRTEFHRLRVAAVVPLTDDSTAVTLEVPPELEQTFAFAAGQTVTVRVGEQRRSYSICAPRGAPLRIGVREVPGGAVSTLLVRGTDIGDYLEMQAPAGSFTPDLAAGGHHVLIAAGSGITPMISIAQSILESAADSSVTLLYGNRSSQSVMFADELADIKDSYPSRVCLVHVLSREPQEVELFNGRLDAAKLRVLLPVTVDPTSVDHWWLCGPLGMTMDAIAVLAELNVPAERIHRELFYVEADPPPLLRHVDGPVGPGAAVTLLLDGRSTTVTVPPDTAILDAAQRVRPDLPFACRGGVCGTCRALVTEGEVRMRRNFALEQGELDAGYVLTCQSLPTTETVSITFDS
ncbi:ring-1,2-phenylacetyl-CoA epoxidase subunit PaaE [Jatrophihabitans sp. GAS493]|uniref:2Fe-2S iron-sulfur cluster-binding protein n=1 Tax=Jatrophihabitans sp. GAS493 TaxID=1907575 RepID=UPI000BB804BB|nr:2Fe-2S iron-sulfur cluster-binding protein [Jatrophihabitans sp. GAS493]SOD72809.1 ring-1,2-phenylacetyl-CoA epoxidase subunit PaaE [Jatrophihabitans sp. GAS493]